MAQEAEMTVIGMGDVVTLRDVKKAKQKAGAELEDLPIGVCGL
jgi:hypothetical protein